MAFRFFGRSAEHPSEARPAWLGDPPPAGGLLPGHGPGEATGVAWAPGPWSDAGPATRAARPVAPAPRPPAYLTDDPLTDPYGFPPVPPAPATGGKPPQLAAYRSPPALDHAEASALAGAFAADYLSWDEDDAARRGRVLGDYLAAPSGDATLLGWSGRGRQRAEFVLPGRVEPDGPGRVLVEVRVRVTPYRAVGERDGADPAEQPPEIDGSPAVAPAPTARGWRSTASRWIRISVPVVRDGGRLAVDADTEPDDTPPAEEPQTIRPTAAPAPGAW
jgi:hypothetical protein